MAMAMFKDSNGCFYMAKVVFDKHCNCGKGYASEVDGLCIFCREHKYSRAQAKSVNVRHRGDGMSLDQEAVILGTKKRSEVYI